MNSNSFGDGAFLSGNELSAVGDGDFFADFSLDSPTSQAPQAMQQDPLKMFADPFSFGNASPMGSGASNNQQQQQQQHTPTPQSDNSNMHQMNGFNMNNSPFNASMSSFIQQQQQPNQFSAPQQAGGVNNMSQSQFSMQNGNPNFSVPMNLQQQQANLQMPHFQAQTNAMNNQNNQQDKNESSKPMESKSSSSSSHTTQKKATRPQKKRKIVSRAKKACLACRRSHVGCDDRRPCKRCLKKGIPCIDSDESSKNHVAFAFNNTLPKKRKSSKEPELMNSDDPNEAATVACEHDEDSSHAQTHSHTLVPCGDPSSYIHVKEFNQLKQVIQRQQQMLTLLMSQMQVQSQELSDLKNNLEIHPTIQNTLFHHVPSGPWNQFSNSKDHGIFVFRNDESQQLLGFNRAMARWKQLDEIDLKTGGWTWWKMSEKKILPKSIMCLVKSGHRSLYFNFKVSLGEEKRITEIRVSIFVEEAVWWIVIDFSMCGEQPQAVKCLPKQTCPLKKERIEKQCKDVEKNFTESMDVLIGAQKESNNGEVPQQQNID